MEFEKININLSDSAASDKEAKPSAALAVPLGPSVEQLVIMQEETAALQAEIIADSEAETAPEEETDRQSEIPTAETNGAEEHEASPQGETAAEEDLKQESPEEKSPPAPQKAKDVKAKIIKDTILLIAAAFIFAVCSGVLFTSGGKITAAAAGEKNFSADVAASLAALKSDSLGAVFDLPKVYILPINEDPAPVANPEGYGSETLEDGTEVLTYNDETISVRYWKERMLDSNCHFAEVKIAHPTQLKTAFAGGKYSSSVRRTPQKIAQQVNAVIAINADYCGYRQRGVIIRQSTLYRNNPCGWDVLFIDSDGNFHIMSDRSIKKSGILEEYEIINSLEFGPSLVVDGEIKLMNIESGCGEYWNEGHVSPRTAIGQIGRLHYLFCCVEGRTDYSKGIYTSQMAQIMYDKGCVQAYNLDGGMSTTMVFNGKAMNYPMWGGQRVVSDIIYCGTAIPNEE